MRERMRRQVALTPARARVCVGCGCGRLGAQVTAPAGARATMRISHAGLKRLMGIFLVLVAPSVPLRDASRPARRPPLLSHPSCPRHPPSCSLLSALTRLLVRQLLQRLTAGPNWLPPRCRMLNNKDSDKAPEGGPHSPLPAAGSPPGLMSISGSQSRVAYACALALTGSFGH